MNIENVVISWRYTKSGNDFNENFINFSEIVFSLFNQKMKTIYYDYEKKSKTCKCSKDYETQKCKILELSGVDIIVIESGPVKKDANFQSIIFQIKKEIFSPYGIVPGVINLFIPCIYINDNLVIDNIIKLGLCKFFSNVNINHGDVFKAREYRSALFYATGSQSDLLTKYENDRQRNWINQTFNMSYPMKDIFWGNFLSRNYFCNKSQFNDFEHELSEAKIISYIFNGNFIYFHSNIEVFQAIYPEDLYNKYLKTIYNILDKYKIPISSSYVYWKNGGVL